MTAELQKGSYRRLIRNLRKRQLNEGEQAALDAVKFCLMKDRQPPRVDVMTLVRIIERLTSVA